MRVSTRSLDRIFRRRGLGQVKSLEQKIKDLFKDGSQGVWYDPSDLTTLFQDSAGTTPVTSLEQPVGLMLDKSRGLVPVTASTPTGWVNAGFSTFNATGTTVSVVSAGYATCGTDPVFTTVAGRFYKIVLNVVSASVPFNVFIGTTGTTYSSKATLSGAGLKTVYLYSTLTSVAMRVVVEGSSALTATLSIVSIEELPGYHAYHTPGDTTTRPTVSRRINLLTKTEDFADAVWVKTQSSVTPNATTAPDGTLTADTFLDAFGGTYAEIKQTAVQVVSGTTYTYAIRAKAGTRRYLYASLGTARFPVATEAIFDLQTGSVKSSGAGIVASSAFVTVDQQGFYVCGFRATATSTGGVEQFLYHTNDAGTSVLYTGTGTGSVIIWGASLVPADLSVLPYQRVNTTTDYDSDASKFPTFLRCDGVNDSLQTNAIDFSGTDKMFVGSAVRKLSDANFGMLAEFSANFTANNGTFFLGAGNQAGTAGAQAYSTSARGAAAANTNQGTDATTYAAPISNILSSTHDIAGDLTTLRVNGTAATPATGDKGTGNFGNYPLYLFRRGGTTLPFNGWMFGALIKGATLSASQIALAERWLASKTKTVVLA